MEKKKRIILAFIVIVLVIFISIFINLFKEDKVTKPNDNNMADKYVYNFGETLDLEDENGLEEYLVIGTDSPNFGIVDEKDIFFVDEDDIIMETMEGYITISHEWKEEGCAREVEQPGFGTLEKFILNGESISVRYTDVTIKEVSKYIKKLDSLGYTDVRLDNMNTKKDYYYFNAKKSDGVTVTITYDNGVMCMDVDD